MKDNARRLMQGNLNRNQAQGSYQLGSLIQNFKSNNDVIKPSYQPDPKPFIRNRSQPSLPEYDQYDSLPPLTIGQSKPEVN